ncbi:MAG TPA: N-acetylmuramic acid 6-phosphate etherase, partial [Candidatus Hypogeohydataceae bacterium YC41]
MPRKGPSSYDRSRLLTERQNPRTIDIDTKSTLEIVDIINREDRTVPVAVARERRKIAKAIDMVVDSFKRKGRLFYVGAGTSGRLGILDAAEMPPTFGTPPGLVRGIIAGGEKAVFRSVEGAEDSPLEGARAIRLAGVSPKDAVVGIAAGGTTPYVQAALKEAHRLGAKTIFLTCVPDVNPEFPVDIVIRPITGPEVITGSTRMKAGTATKLVLNTITTGAMIKMGLVYGNLMVDLRATNKKLTDRAERIVMEVTGLSRTDTRALLKKAHGQAKTAILMHLQKLDYKEA